MTLIGWENLEQPVLMITSTQVSLRWEQWFYLYIQLNCVVFGISKLIFLFFCRAYTVTIHTILSPSILLSLPRMISGEWFGSKERLLSLIWSQITKRLKTSPYIHILGYLSWELKWTFLIACRSSSIFPSVYPSVNFYTFSSSPEPLGQFQPALSLSILGWNAKFLSKERSYRHT